MATPPRGAPSRRNNWRQLFQLQYTQTVVLNFLGIDWPHISVATLVKR